MIWNPDPIAFSISNTIHVSWYGLTWSLAIIVGYLLSGYFFRLEGKNLNKQITLIQYLFLGCLIGARVFDIFYYNLDQFLIDPLVLFRVWEGGLASHGAIIGTILAIFIFSKRHKDFSFWWIMDRSAIIFPLLGAIIRIGNFMNSELFGTPTNLPWGVKFVQANDPFLITRHPVQLYESLWLIVCFAIFFWLYKNNQKRFDGFFAALFLIVVLGGRLLLEFFKFSEVYFGFLSNTQWVSVLAVCLGSFLFYLQKKKSNVVHK